MNEVNVQPDEAIARELGLRLYIIKCFDGKNANTVGALAASEDDMVAMTASVYMVGNSPLHMELHTPGLDALAGFLEILPKGLEQVFQLPVYANCKSIAPATAKAFSQAIKRSRTLH